MKNLRIRDPAKRLLALTIAGATIFSTGATSQTLTALAAESNAEETFIPFRSYFVDYLSEYSGKFTSESKYIWMKMFAEQYDDSTWASKYYASTVLPGGTYLTEDSAKGKAIYSAGTSNPVYDQLLANEINAEGVSFLKSWINGYTDASGNVVLSAEKGKDMFIKFFDSESTSFSETAKAVVAVTKTAEGNSWLQGYTYTNNGGNEATVGITLLKLFCADFDDLNDNQLAWVKGYLPYLLNNYAASGSSALAASTKNAYLYDFMARSINGAQYTGTKAQATTVSANGVSLGNVAAGTSLQQEFFNYVVESSTGFGQFVQNIIGGGMYTGAYSNSYDLTGFETVSSMYFGTNDSDIDYYTASANGGDKDTDWFMHAMYLNSSQFTAVKNLTNNNATAKNWFDKWVMRFSGKTGSTVTWNYLSNQTSSGSLIAQANWAGYSGGFTGSVVENDPAEIYAKSYTNQLLEGINFGREKSLSYISFSWYSSTDATFTYYTPLNQDYSKPETICITLNGGNLFYFSGNVYVRAISSTGEIVSQASGTTNFTLTISEQQWNTYGKLYLQIYVPVSTIQSMGYSAYTSSFTRAFGLAVSSVTLGFSSSQSCINGHNFGDWLESYSSDYKTCRIKHTCKTCGVDETEIVTASVTENYDSTIYTYTPVMLASVKSAWTKTISKDFGSGTKTFNSSSNVSEGSWSKTATGGNVVTSHTVVNGVWNVSAVRANSVSETFTISSGIIKANAKTITVTSPYSDNKITVGLYSKSGTLLKQVSAQGSAKLDVSDLTIENKTSCYLRVEHNRTCSTEVIVPYYSYGWAWSPSVPLVTTTTTINNVTVTY